MKKRFERTIKTKTKRDSFRNLFDELNEGMKALVDACKGKLTLQTFVAESYYLRTLLPQNAHSH